MSEEVRAIIEAMERLCRRLNCRFVIDPDKLRIFEQAAINRRKRTQEPNHE